MSTTDALTITSAPDALTRYYYAKEREEGAVLYINDAYLEAVDALEKLEAENARLREMVRILAYCMSEDRNCDRCVFNGADMPTPRISACDSLPDRLRELGVEVGG